MNRETLIVQIQQARRLSETAEAARINPRPARLIGLPALSIQKGVSALETLEFPFARRMMLYLLLSTNGHFWRGPKRIGGHRVLS